VSVTAIVLAGGRSSRFGSAKLAVELDGRSLLDHAIEAVAAVATETIVVVAPDGPAPHPRPGVRTVRDPEAFGGPLVGLAAGLEATTGDLAIVVGGDMPLLRPVVLEAMLAALGEPANLGPERDHPPSAVALADVGGRRPLPLALAVERARVAMFVALTAGQRSLQALLDQLDVRTLSNAEWRHLDPSGGTLVDVDRPEDLDRVRASDPGGRGLP
jgi:molybdopterin-guanine dinucleotide biosynthesis protein A